MKQDLTKFLLHLILYNAKGPNYSWHTDGYDKLKPYGIAIHGCIDGYVCDQWVYAAKLTLTMYSQFLSPIVVAESFPK